MTLSRMIKGYGCFLALAAGFLILGSLSAYYLTLSTAYTLTLGAVWYECLENGQMLISGIVPPRPAYPMWGYCFLVALLGKPLIIVQALLAFMFIVFCYFSCRRSTSEPLKTFPSITEQLILGVLLIPWFFLVTTSLTKSITSLLICVGTCCLYKGATKKNLPLLIVAGASLGLGFNFRSEVIILAGFYFVALSAHVLRTGGNLGSKVKQLVSFAAVVVIFTIPWLVYTKLTVGHSLLTSTNSGAVKYLGLGTLPNNPWGIIPNDDYAWDIARDQGLESPWGFDGDRFFTNRFIEAVNAHLPSFLHRILTGWRLMFMQGLYFPDFRQFFLIDTGNGSEGPTQDYIAYDFLNEKLKETVGLKIDDTKLKVYEADGVGFDQVKIWHWLAVLGEYSVRGIFALVFLCTVGALCFRAFRCHSWHLCITLPLACLGFELLISGFIQTLPSHTTQIWPVLIMFQLQSYKNLKT